MRPPCAFQMDVAQHKRLERNFPARSKSSRSKATSTSTMDQAAVECIMNAVSAETMSGDGPSQSLRRVSKGMTKAGTMAFSMEVLRLQRRLLGMGKEGWVPQQHGKRKEGVECNEGHCYEVEINNLSHCLLAGTWCMVVERRRFPPSDFL